MNNLDVVCVVVVNPSWIDTKPSQGPLKDVDTFIHIHFDPFYCIVYLCICVVYIVQSFFRTSLEVTDPRLPALQCMQSTFKNGKKEILNIAHVANSTGMYYITLNVKILNSHTCVNNSINFKRTVRGRF